MSQEQWDIYKLDPRYDCYVPPDGSPPIISVVQQEEISRHGSTSSSSQSSQASFSSFAGSSKRSFSSSDSEITPQRATKRRAFIESDEEDEEEVAEIVEEMQAGPSYHDKVHQQRATMEKKRNERREKLRSAQQVVSSADELEDGICDLTMDDAEDIPAEYPFKHGMDDDDEDHVKRTKKARLSPSARRAAKGNRLRGIRKVVDSYASRRRKVAQARDSFFFETLINDARSYSTNEENPHPQSKEQFVYTIFAATNRSILLGSHVGGSSQHDQDEPISRHESESAEGSEDLQDKIRRMREFEEREAAQRRSRRAEEEAARRKAEETARRKAEEEARMKAEEEARKREEIERAKAARQRRRMKESWRYGEWTDHRALAYYLHVSEFFDSEKFTPECPIEFEDIPWPLCFKPGTYDYTNIEDGPMLTFFHTCRRLLSPKEYKALLQGSRKRFHPDRWAAKRRYDGLDSEWRRRLELCVEVVSKMIGSQLLNLDNHNY